ncbi:hypothetical protein EVAR_87626_1 [Eumeta japonica]|uniref:Uncharacterized protein n=1 Tax=Eumeta variegata TaxID=151549 RepID=A0A4C1WL71_EUMVA|nr:hypothetical protein EVAR_87626_1 [Eumeta japonica]
MSGRKYKSGAEKRKLQLDREKEKINVQNWDFFKSKHKNEDEIAENSSTSDKGGIESEENLFEGVANRNTKKQRQMMKICKVLTISKSSNPLIKRKTILVFRDRVVTPRRKEIYRILILNLRNMLTWPCGQNC